MGSMANGGLPKLAVETVQFYYCQDCYRLTVCDSKVRPHPTVEL